MHAYIIIMKNIKQRIIETAFKLLVRNNFEYFTMKEIHYAIGVSRGTLYNYFTNREGIYSEIIMSYLMPVFSESLSSIKSSKNLHQAIFRSIEIKYNLLSKIKKVILTNKNLLLFINQAYILDIGLEDRIKRSISLETQEWKRILNDSKESGEIKMGIDSKMVSYFLAMAPINYFTFMLFNIDFCYEDLKKNLEMFYDNIKR